MEAGCNPHENVASLASCAFKSVKAAIANGRFHWILLMHCRYVIRKLIVLLVRAWSTPGSCCCDLKTAASSPSLPYLTSSAACQMNGGFGADNKEVSRRCDRQLWADRLEIGRMFAPQRRRVDAETNGSQCARPTGQLSNESADRQGWPAIESLS